MEGPPYERIKKALDQYPANEFWNEIFGPLRLFLKSKVRKQFPRFTEADALEVSDETIKRIYESCDFLTLSALPENERNRKFFKFLKTTMFNAAVDSIRQRTGRNPLKNTPPITRRIKPKPPSKILWQVFGELSAADQELLLLKDVDGLTYEQITVRYCFETGFVIGVEALTKRRLRALAQLVRRLKDVFEEGA